MNAGAYVPRALERYAFDEALTGRHMVFVAGPRQVGKTRLARQWLLAQGCSSLYFNWDDPGTRASYRESSRFFESPARGLGTSDPWIVFDEIHKQSRWRDILKGAYDLLGEQMRFLVTGSARLDLYRRGGDSLVGRYNLFHLFPFSLGELLGKSQGRSFLEPEPEPDIALGARFEQALGRHSAAALPEAHQALGWLVQFGPFPEPLLRQSDRFSRKWHQDYLTLVVREDLRDISRVSEVDRLEHLLALLPSRVGSPLSLASLGRDLEAAHTTVKSWMEQLRVLYLVFPVPPWSRRIGRSLRKAKKWYFLDWRHAPEGPARLENLVATALQRVCHALTDMGYGSYQLHYVRTLDRSEIDFVVAHEHTPVLALEVKSADTRLSRPLRERDKWFAEPTLGLQVVNRPGVLHRHDDRTWVLGLDRFLLALG